MTLASDQEPLTADGVTEILAAVLDELDGLGMTPSVTSEGVGATVDVDICVGYELGPNEDAMDGYQRGFTAVRSALHAAGLGTPGLAVTTRVDSSFRQPEPA